MVNLTKILSLFFQHFNLNPLLFYHHPFYDFSSNNIEIPSGVLHLLLLSTIICILLHRTPFNEKTHADDTKNGFLHTFHSYTTKPGRLFNDFQLHQQQKTIKKTLNK